jgi:putative DNA primase/helicase
VPDDLSGRGASATLAIEPPEFSDDAVALAFSARHAGQLLFVPEWGRWLRWDGSRWAHDATLAVFDLARTVCREKAEEAERAMEKASPWSIGKLASAQKVAAVTTLARADRRHARAADLFDADPWSLNTRDGVVDLRTGTMRRHRQDDLFTKVTTVAPGGECERWCAFLSEITQGDDEALAYIRRWCGYVLTGSTREHAFLFLHGPGGNGKTVLMSTIAAAMGDYAAVADMSLFTAQRNEAHPTGLAGLRGARLVTASEIEAGAVLAEARLKAMTGGDKIAARFMRADFFEYVPTFKVWMAGNHQPTIKNPDDAMRRRLHLLPLTFRPAEPDRDLTDQLRSELPGILRWAIGGCLEWQREGLGLPEVVRAATDAYFVDQDNVASWLEDRCQAVAGRETFSSVLFRDWAFWCDQRGEAPGTNKAFSAALERRYAKKRDGAGVKFVGLELLP